MAIVLSDEGFWVDLSKPSSEFPDEHEECDPAEVVAALERALAEKAEAHDALEREVARLKEALADYGEHKRGDCILSQWRGGRPTADGGYEWNYGGTWYSERPLCTCGLDAFFDPA